MGPAERRQALLEVLCIRRNDTYDNLAREFDVSKMKIRRDVAVLMCAYPIETVHGGRHGCVRVAEGYYLNHKCSARKSLTPKQTELLRKVRKQLAGDDLDTLNSILVQFAPRAANSRLNSVCKVLRSILASQSQRLPVD